ncbi:tor signaling pathway regulator [Sporothrix brasiliensis 5110]|uniref:Tor signaling pathway regulator n=1 Tax=Sporothrix brasiliensis 5110 TaxID=1398154 RepID=A0A0C2ESC5_9PEZI|nr:tor signaling pathway regulator [Sporothrix brasiliensis 5110]KIH89259.1 tor signaling pathway regulator [Sporothrix brasiliensis 5110]
MSSAEPQQREPRSVKVTYLAAERLRDAIERGAFHPGGAGLASRNGNNSAGTPLSYGEAVREALASYVECGRRVQDLALFSTNESVEDISTAHLPYLLVPYRIAELSLKLPTAQPGPPERRAVLKQAREAYERFLHHLDGYGLLTTPYARLLQAYTEDPTHFSTLGPTGGIGTSTASSGGAGSGLAGLADPAARRNAKIAAFRAEKELRDKLDVLRQRQQQRRELSRRRRQRLRVVDGSEDKTGDAPVEGSSSLNAEAGVHDEDDEEDDGDDDEGDDDEEEARKLHLAALFYSAHMAFQGLEGINVEDDILAKAPVPLMPHGSHGPSAGGLGDNRQRPAGATERGGGDLTRVDDLRNMGSTPVLRRLQSALAGSPTWAGSVNPGGSGPLLSKDGKPKQPFTILGSRAEMAKNVFRPGHNLPTMSIDEYLEEERKRGGIIEGGGPSSGIPPVPDEDNYEKADAETMKQRAWDEFTEANPRGAGNTLNRG